MKLSALFLSVLAATASGFTTAEYQGGLVYPRKFTSAYSERIGNGGLKMYRAVFDYDNFKTKMTVAVKGSPADSCFTFLVIGVSITAEWNLGFQFIRRKNSSYHFSPLADGSVKCVKFQSPFMDPPPTELPYWKSIYRGGLVQTVFGGEQAAIYTDAFTQKWLVVRGKTSTGEPTVQTFTNFDFSVDPAELEVPAHIACTPAGSRAAPVMPRFFFNG